MIWCYSVGSISKEWLNYHKKNRKKSITETMGKKVWYVTTQRHQLFNSVDVNNYLSQNAFYNLAVTPLFLFRKEWSGKS